MSRERRYEIKRSEFEIGEVLAEGNFGVVHKGKLYDYKGNGATKEVAIKMANTSINQTYARM